MRISSLKRKKKRVWEQLIVVEFIGDCFVHSIIIQQKFDLQSIQQNTISLKSKTEMEKCPCLKAQIFESFGGVLASFHCHCIRIPALLSPAAWLIGTASEISLMSSSLSFTPKEPMFESRFLIFVVPAVEIHNQMDNVSMDRNNVSWLISWANKCW